MGVFALPLLVLLVQVEPTSKPVPLGSIEVVNEEPRYVAPTRKDRIGRIWAPVTVNGQGPFRLALAWESNFFGGLFFPKRRINVKVGVEKCVSTETNLYTNGVEKSETNGPKIKETIIVY